MRATKADKPRNDKKNPYDVTSTQRQDAHLERLVATEGKRLPVDLDGERLAKLEELIAEGYEKSMAAAIRKAIDAAHRAWLERR